MCRRLHNECIEDKTTTSIVKPHSLVVFIKRVLETHILQMCRKESEGCVTSLAELLHICRKEIQQ